MRKWLRNNGLSIAMFLLFAISFQNWQSEFLSVGVLIVLSVFLRERRSPESKPVADPQHETGR